MTDSTFQLEIRKPFSTFTEGKPTPIPYIIDGLLPDAAFSVLGGAGWHTPFGRRHRELVPLV